MEPVGRPILVVEDDGDVREVIALVLEDAGMRVQGVCDGESCLALLQGGLRPSVIVMDLQLPGMHGPEVLARLRLCEHAGRGTPVVFISGCSRPEVPDGVPLLPKPFEVEDLLGTVARLAAAS